MLQILIWGLGVVLIGMGYFLLYMTQAFPTQEIIKKYRCESCGQIRKASAPLLNGQKVENSYKCDCGGYFFHSSETKTANDQPFIYKLIAYALIAAGPIIIVLANIQANAVTNLPIKF